MLKKTHIISLLFTLLFINSKAQIKSAKLLADTITMCYGDSVLLKVSDDNFSKNVFYQWQTPSIIITRTKQLYVKQKGKYILKIIDGKKTYFDTTYIKAVEKPKFNIRDTVLCSNNPVVLSVSVIKNQYYKLNWSSGDVGYYAQIEKTGKHWLKATYKGCSYTDTFKVSAGVGTIPSFGKEYVVCESEPNKVLSVKAPSDVKLYWNTGSNSSSIVPTKEGIYWVKSISKNCGTKTDSVNVKFKNCDCEVFIPNSFSPNEDDKNDYFAPVFQCEYGYFALTIMDRWGNMVYTSNNINSKWDGRFKNNPCPDDVYVYRLEAIQKGNDKKIIRTGHISLFR